jgi:hypothetical protein
MNWCLLDTWAVPATSAFLPCSLFLPLLQVPRKERETERWLLSYAMKRKRKRGRATHFYVQSLQRGEGAEARVYGGRLGCYASLGLDAAGQWMLPWRAYKASCNMPPCCCYLCIDACRPAKCSRLPGLCSQAPA